MTLFFLSPATTELNRIASYINILIIVIIRVILCIKRRCTKANVLFPISDHPSRAISGHVQSTQG